MTATSGAGTLFVFRELDTTGPRVWPTASAPGDIIPEDPMQHVKKPRRALLLHTETVRQLASVELNAVIGGQTPVGTVPCSIPCTDICSSGL